jgi:quinol monooxygenase YgiN
MEIHFITLRVKPERVEAFRAASLANVRKSAQEPGVLRFELYQGASDPVRFHLLEAYRDGAARDEHLTSEHFQAWRLEVADMLAEPPVSVGLEQIFPTKAAGRD